MTSTNLSSTPANGLCLEHKRRAKRANIFDTETNRLIVFAGEDWEGEELFDLVDLSADGTLEHSARGRYRSTAISLAEQTEVGLLAGTAEIRLRLSELLSGTADPRGIEWSAQGPADQVRYDEESEELVLTRATPWQGSDMIELRASTGTERRRADW